MLKKSGQAADEDRIVSGWPMTSCMHHTDEKLHQGQHEHRMEGVPRWLDPGMGSLDKIAPSLTHAREGGDESIECAAMRQYVGVANIEGPAGGIHAIEDAV
ncbi:hypothetical protein GOP47_0025194 [Adiantum capillus-veneris]|uniref:Uncharacterized protein n=1 Tax=Adiantum capillus-veneris TaxID=13818 RepID=A0A9D4Z4B6_ADICA|nr:hypothetical protein GOP47_0025194 [Adiantum capillus-veneris]